MSLCSACNLIFINRQCSLLVEDLMVKCWLANSYSIWIGICLWYSLNWSFHSFVGWVWASYDVMFAWVGVYAKISHSGRMLLGLAVALYFSLGLLAWSILITDFRPDVSYINCILQFENIALSHASYFLEQNIMKMKWGRWLWGRCYERVFRWKLFKAQPY